jgi:hypothetical protein
MDVIENLQPAVREAVAAAAVERINAPDVAAISEWQVLQSFAPCLRGSPRDIKRFINTYSILRTVRTLEGIVVGSDALALWTVIKVRWPAMADFLAANPEGAAFVAADPPQVESLPDAPRRIANLLNFREALNLSRVQLTPELVRTCCGASDPR